MVLFIFLVFQAKAICQIGWVSYTDITTSLAQEDHNQPRDFRTTPWDGVMMCRATGSLAAVACHAWSHALAMSDTDIICVSQSRKVRLATIHLVVQYLYTIYIYIYVCIYICIHIYIYTHWYLLMPIAYSLKFVHSESVHMGGASRSHPWRLDELASQDKDVLAMSGILRHVHPSVINLGVSAPKKGHGEMVVMAAPHSLRFHGENMIHKNT